MMILAQMLAGDEGHNLTPTQREHAETIHGAGRDLLALINQILDLAKIEAGRIDVHTERIPLEDSRALMERMFRPTALQHRLEFLIAIADDAPPTITTDRQMLEQILKNLLANAFKFTETGRVALRIHRAAPTLEYRSSSLQTATAVLAFSVSDSGIGVSAAKLEILFEAFQQGDPSITRKYGGTGLGLPIVALTAKASNTDRAQREAAGCVDYVVKPVEIRSLVAVQRRLLQRE